MDVLIDGVRYVPAPVVPESGTLGEILRVRRAQLGFTLEEACQAAKISKAFLWELEQDKSTPSLRAAARLSTAYGIPLEALAACYQQEQRA